LIEEQSDVIHTTWTTYSYKLCITTMSTLANWTACTRKRFLYILLLWYKVERFVTKS